MKMTTHRSFSLALQGFLFFLTRHLTAYSCRFLKIRTQNQVKHGDWQAQKSPQTKKGPVLPKETFRFFISGHGKQREAFFHVCG